MKLSIIITCYNQKEFIKEAVDSALNQKLNDSFEIIIADDGSNDGSWEFILEEYGNRPNIKCFTMKRDRKLHYLSHVRASQCRLESLKYVSGEYFAYLDGDDFYCDELAMQKKIDILDKPENSDVVLAGSRCIIYSDGKFGNILGPERLPEGKVKTKLYWKIYYTSSNVCMFRSSIIPKLPYHIIDKVFNDNIIVFTALQYGIMYFSKDVSMAYRQNTHQSHTSIWVTNSTRANHIRQVMDIDIANKLNPQLYKESYYRYSSSVNALLKSHRESSDRDLYELAKELSCKETLQILTWRENNLINKTCILAKHFFLLIFCKSQWWCRHILLQTRFQKYIH